MARNAQVAVPMYDDQEPIAVDMPLDMQTRILHDLIAHPPYNSRILEIGPLLAKYILDRLNTNNRPMKGGKIRTYTADLLSGEWGLTGDTIKFGTDGLLKDGQNRLAAVVKSKRPLVTHVVFGIEPSLFSRMDIGKNRTATDIFAIAGHKYAHHTAAAVRWLKILTSDNPANRAARYTNEELLHAYEQVFDRTRLEHSIKMALEVQKTTGHPVGALAALHYIFAEANLSKADEFYTEWASGRYSQSRSRSPVALMQARLTELASLSNNRVHETVRNATIITAWQAYITSDRKFGRASLVFDPAAIPTL